MRAPGDCPALTGLPTSSWVEFGPAAISMALARRVRSQAVTRRNLLAFAESGRIFPRHHRAVGQWATDRVFGRGSAARPPAGALPSPRACPPTTSFVRGGAKVCSSGGPHPCERSRTGLGCPLGRGAGGEPDDARQAPAWAPRRIYPVRGELDPIRMGGGGARAVISHLRTGRKPVSRGARMTAWYPNQPCQTIPKSCLGSMPGRPAQPRSMPGDQSCPASSNGQPVSGVQKQTPLTAATPRHRWATSRVFPGRPSLGPTTGAVLRLAQRRRSVHPALQPIGRPLLFLHTSRGYIVWARLREGRASIPSNAAR